MPPWQKNSRSMYRGFVVCQSLSPIPRRIVSFNHPTPSIETTPREIYANHVGPQTLKDSPPAWHLMESANMRLFAKSLMRQFAHIAHIAEVDSFLE